MNRTVGFGLLSSFALLAVPGAAASAARELTLEDRTRHQRAIEEVYWSHRIWPKDNPTPKPPLSDVLPDEVLRARVEDYLKKSTALETVWQHPITGTELQAELDRMVRDTRDAPMLRDLFHALGDDPFVVAETLARQTLVDRLARDWYSQDERFHAALGAKAETARAECRTVADMKTVGGTYQEMEFSKGPSQGLSSGRSIRLDPLEWDQHRAMLTRRFPGGTSGADVISTVEETGEAFDIMAILAEGSYTTTIATVTWEKIPFDTWWSGQQASLSIEIATISDEYELASPAGSGCTPDTWRATAGGPPASRQRHTAVFTGSEMIVWGGSDQSGATMQSGGRYNPATDTWIATSQVNAPTARDGHTAVWTGSEMIVWGGKPASSPPPIFDTGGRYNPATDTWIPTSTGSGVPSARTGHTAVWTGNVMIIWGGAGTGGSGALYSPSTDSWTVMLVAGSPGERTLHSAVWTGSDMIVWGGLSGGNPQNTGGRYNPMTNSWSAMTTTGAPSARHSHSGVWTGSQMIVWGGAAPPFLFNTGARYTPASDSWTATSSGTGVPTARQSHTALWTGTSMLIWGGSSSGPLGDGSSYDPAGNLWTVIPAGANVPSPRFYHAAVWTGTEMILWGGSTGGSVTNTGGRYAPANTSWLATSIASPPSARYSHTSVWTGSEMIVWGGSGSTAVGFRYDPGTGSWTATSAAPTFVVHENHSAVWTGTEMIVAGGVFDIAEPFAMRYKPSTNTWTSASNGSAPANRDYHSAVWTGSVMVVWGGEDSANGGAGLKSGGRYNPATNTWAATNLATAPVGRLAHSAVWTGSEMIVWGGGTAFGPASNALNSGGRYNPITDLWFPTSEGANVPSARFFQATAWTGADMIVERRWNWGRHLGCPLHPSFRYLDPDLVGTERSRRQGKSGNGVDGNRHGGLGRDRQSDGNVLDNGRPLQPKQRFLAADIHGERAAGSTSPHGSLDGLRDDRLGRLSVHRNGWGLLRCASRPHREWTRQRARRPEGRSRRHSQLGAGQWLRERGHLRDLRRRPRQLHEPPPDRL